MVSKGEGTGRWRWRWIVGGGSWRVLRDSEEQSNCGGRVVVKVLDDFLVSGCAGACCIGTPNQLAALLVHWARRSGRCSC